MKSGCSDAFKLDTLALNKANERSDAGTGDLGVLTTHDISSMKNDYTTEVASDYGVPEKRHVCSSRFHWPSVKSVILCRKDDLNVAYWSVRTLQDVGVLGGQLDW